MDIETMTKLLSMVYESTGKWGVIQFLTLVVLGVICYGLLIFLFKLYAKQNEAQLSLLVGKELEKEKMSLELALRDEVIRTSIIETTQQDANKIRISLFQEVYNMHFAIMYAKQDPNYDENAYIQKINAIRTKIFLNAIYLGDLTSSLLEAQIALWDIARNIPAGNSVALKASTKFSQNITEAEKWLRDNLKTNYSLSDFDISEETETKIRDNREKMIP